jgi:hypothetical protein
MNVRTNYLFAIGIDVYKTGEFDKLANAVSDCTALVDVLELKYSFELIQEPLYNEQATKENILFALTNIIHVLTENDNLIIYYGGHGFMHPTTQKGYWVPHEARKNTADFIANSEIKDFIQAMPAKHIFLIADACFSGTFLSRTRGSSFHRSYASLDNKRSRWMLASGGEETVSDGPSGQSSPFAKFLLKFLNENANKYISVVELTRYVSVLTSHHSKQQPRGAHIERIGHDGGEMVLILSESWVKTSISKSNGQPQTEELSREMRSVYRRRSKISGGKEIFLVDSFINADDLQIWECFRFDNAGKKKLKFEKNKVKIAANDDPNLELNLHARFATWEGLARYWDEHEHLYDGKKVIALRAVKEIEDVEETPMAISQQEIIQDMLDANESLLKCLHCEQMITTNDSYLVEIDEANLNANAGNVHAECLRPADRILGRTIFPDAVKSNLVNFDYEKWLTLISKGQALIYNVKKTTESDKTPILSWNKKHNFNNGSYCINMILEDGNSQYVRLGKEIHRFNESEIDNEVSDFNKSILEAKAKGETLGVTSQSRIFGTSHQLKTFKLNEEVFLELVRVEKARYSKQLDTIDERYENDYTPLGIPIDLASGQFIAFGNCVPLISDPTKFEALYENWNSVGYKTRKCTLKIVENDKELDLYLIAFFSDGMQPIIDPHFDKNKDLAKGVYISDIEDLKNETQTQTGILNPDGLWKAGDRVKVVFPNVETDNYARGILLTDEFVDDTNTTCVIFRPIEDGIVREDLQFKMPAKLLVKD